MIPKKIVIAQMGAREHFLAARSLQRHGLLAGLVTDWYAPQSGLARGMLRLLGKRGAASAMAAECGEILRSNVRSFPFRSLLWKWRIRRQAARGRLYEAYTETDAEFARTVAKCDLPAHDVFFGYSYGSLEALEAEKRRGKLTVLDQIDPGPVEFRIVAEEMARYPELAGPPAEFPAAHCRRNQREWQLADVILVNSEWCREAIIKEGADAAKIELLPLAFEPKAQEFSAVNGNHFQVSEANHSAIEKVPLPPSAPLRVLWLGQVNVRKGIHYLMEAAKLLAPESVHIDVVGPIGILPQVVASARRLMTFHGPVSRDRVGEWYRQSEVFILPTLSDGFALTQLEAMAHGLPVITTPNCGRVVEEGVTGFIVAARDPQALAVAIMRFVQNRNLASEMSPKCRQAAAAFSISAYGRRLVEIVNQKWLAFNPASNIMNQKPT